MSTALELAKEKLLKQQELLEYFASAPFDTAVILEVRPDNVLVTYGGAIKVALKPKEFEVRVGMTVAVAGSTGAIIQELGFFPANRLMKVLGFYADLAEVGDEDGRTTRVVGYDTKPEIGDSVMLDFNDRVIVKNFGQTKKVAAKQSKDIGLVHWDEIGGQEVAKAALREIVEMPFTNPELYRSYGKRPPKGVLLSGPPGCGKTMLGKATATALSTLPGSFIHMKGPEILDPFVGVAEARIRAAFAQARRFKEESGRPAVLFIDEAEAVLSRRGSTRSSDVDKTIVTQFLTEMDGIEDSAAVVILATNRPEMLDPAVVRDGRIDRKVSVERPTKRDATTIMATNLRRVPTAADHEELAQSSVELLYSDQLLVQGRLVRDTVNGAMVAGLVDKATTAALRRDISAGKKKASGIKFTDLETAIMGLSMENSRISME